MKGKVSYYLYCRGFYFFMFKLKEDKDLILKSGPDFMDPREMYLNICSLEFDPEVDIPLEMVIWVRLPHLPLHY
jgi:hypothetical protein